MDKKQREQGLQLFHHTWLIGDCHPHIFAYYYKQWQNYKMDFHMHASLEIMYVITGECTVELAPEMAGVSTGEQLHGDAGSVIYSLTKGTFILLNGNVPHRLLVDEHAPCRMLNIEFDMREGKGIFPSLRKLAAEEKELALLLKERASHLVQKDTGDLYPVLKKLVLELDNHTGSRLQQELLFAELMLSIAYIYSSRKTEGGDAADRYVREAIAFMHHHYDQDIQVSQIAQAVNLHPGYLHRVFSRQTGLTITAYLTRLRMEKAQMLLAQTDIAISDICDYVGIGSRQYFHAVFKKHVGMTPISYRQSIQPSQWLYGDNASEGDDF